MDFQLTEEQTLIQDMAKNFAATELAPHSAKWDEEKFLDRAVFALSLIHISEPTRPRLISYAVFCLKKKI